MPTLERLSLGTTIITEAVIMAENPSSKIPRDRLQLYMNYRLPKMAWDKTAYSILMRSVKSLSASSWTGDSYEVSGFALAINLWAMSSVNVLGKSLGKPCETSSSSDPLCLHWDSTRTPTITEVLELEKINNFPLCLHWTETKPLTIEEVNRFDQMEKVDVKCILGDPELHSDLVEDVDCEFGRVVDLFKRGYRLKRQDWLNGSIDIAVAEAEVDENNSVPGIDATDHEKIEFLTKKVVSLEERIKYLEGLLNIRGETVKETEKSKETEAATKTKVNGQNADYELDETELLQDYIDAKRKEIAKRNKNGVRPPREVDHQDEDDTDVEVNEEQPQEVEEQQEEDDTAVDVDVSDKESENPETNEGQTQEEEEQQQEDDTEVNIDVDVGAKESENPKTNEDGEVNEDASEKPVKGTKKRGRGTKDGEVNEDASEKPVKGTKKRGRGTKDGEVNEDASEKPVKGTKKSKRGTKDGEVNEDASEKPVKGTKKRGRGTKGKKKGVTSPREVEDDAEVDAKETENPKTNEDGEVNEDASKKNVKGTKKRGRVTKGKKKGVTPPREVQQQVEDDAETNEDGEGNEDASKNHVKFTKKHGRRNKEHIVETPKSKKQKKQSEKDSAADVIGCVLEDLKKAD
ncbi:hypothetical protein Bca4012_048180 [Brassica carinata]